MSKAPVLKKQWVKTVKEVNNHLVHLSEVDDLVMVTVTDTSTNPVNLHKPKMRWQGPFTVVATEVNDPSVLHLRLLGYPDTVKPKAVHWTRCRRFAGKDFHATPALVKSAQHDFGKFRIRDFLAWRMGEGGTVEMLVAWHGFDDEGSSWEPIEQLLEDAPYRVRNYLAENASGHPPLQQVYDSAFD